MHIVIIQREVYAMTDKTKDLMDKLMSTDTPEDLGSYMEAIRDKYPNSLSSYFKAVLAEKGMSIADMQKESGIDRTYIYQIMDGSKNPTKDKIVAMAIACRMTLPECQRALEIADTGILYAKSRRDALIIYAISNGLNIRDLNGLFEEYDLPQLN